MRQKCFFSFFQNKTHMFLHTNTQQRKFHDENFTKRKFQYNAIMLMSSNLTHYFIKQVTFEAIT
jgi:hypothetical protein